MVLEDQAAPSLRAIRWKHPRRNYPTVIEMALAKIAAAPDKPRSAQWLALFGDAPITRKDADGQAVGRRRRKRIDGAINVASVLSTLIAAADIARGLVATPAGDKWQRKSWSDIDALAFGPLVVDQRSKRRTERAAAELESQGFIRSIPWRVITAEGVRGVPGLKFITDKLWKALGLWGAVQSERRRRKQKEGDAKKAQIEAAIGGAMKNRTVERRTRTSSQQERHQERVRPIERPPSQAGPRLAGEIAAASIAALKKILDD
jgi:hypothetical protein